MKTEIAILQESKKTSSEEVFYKLTPSDLAEIVEMKESEIKIYLWLKLQLRFVDSRAIEVDTAFIAEQTGLSRRTVQRVLQQSTVIKQEFEIEVSKVRIRRIDRLSAQQPPTRLPLPGTATAKTTSDTADMIAPQETSSRHRCRQTVSDDAQTLPVSPTQPETLTQYGVQISQTSTDSYRLFKDSLSERERESFFSFCQNELAGLPRKIASIGDYLAANDASGEPRFREFYCRFCSTRTGEQIQEEKTYEQFSELSLEQIAKWDDEFHSLELDGGAFVRRGEDANSQKLRQKYLDNWRELRNERERKWLENLTKQEKLLLAEQKLPFPKFSGHQKEITYTSPKKR